VTAAVCRHQLFCS